MEVINLKKIRDMSVCRRRYELKHIRKSSVVTPNPYDFRRLAFKDSLNKIISDNEGSLELRYKNKVADEAYKFFETECMRQDVAPKMSLQESIYNDFLCYYEYIVKDLLNSKDVKIKKGGRITKEIPASEEMKNQYILESQYDLALIIRNKDIVLYNIEFNKKNYSKEHEKELRFLLYNYYLNKKSLPSTLGYLIPMKKKTSYLGNLFFKKNYVSQLKHDIISYIKTLEEGKFPFDTGNHCKKCSFSSFCYGYSVYLEHKGKVEK